MQAHYNYSALFNQTNDTTSVSFIPKIDLSAQRERLLKQLAKKIVDGLKLAFKELPSYLPDAYLNKLTDKERTILTKLTPKFRVQGSFSYATVNDPVPQYSPPQEVDIDIGCYIPLEYAEENPSLAHALLFEIIDNVLTVITSQNPNWKAICDKDTCGRLKTDQGVHVDVVAYATPEVEFKKFVESQKLMFASNESRKAQLEDTSIDFFKKELLHFEKVNMAHRSEGWKESDPKLVTDWFNKRCTNEKYLRHLSKILKAWRDFTWKDGQGPSSISLMVMASHIFGQHTQPHSLMDALILVTTNIIGLMQQDQFLPVEPYDKVWPRSSDEEHKTETIEAFSLLNAQLYSCKFTETTKDSVVDKLIAQFGDRLPKRPDWIVDVKQEPDKTIVKPVPTPNIKRENTTAG